MQNDERSNMLGTMAMSKLVPTLSVPIMVSMLVQALYNVVDSIFVARIGGNTDALTAVSLAYPIQMLMIAVGGGMATGINSLISRKLGERKPEAARSAACNGLMLQLIDYLIFLVVGLFLARPIMHVLASDPTLFELSSEYLEIVCTFSLGLFIAMTFERFMQATGNTMLSMASQMTGAVVNIILDPIMIFGYFGFPALGVRGAAIATCIGQVCGMTVGILLNQTRNREMAVRLKEFRVNGGQIREMLSVGIPSMVMQAISSVMNVLLNAILLTFGNAAVSVLSVYFKLQSFIFMPVFGLGNGLVAICGYNYGAGNKKRVYSSIKVALVWAACIMAVGVILFWAIPTQLISLFDAEGGELTRIGVSALHIISTHFLIAAVGITISTVFQAVGKGTYSMIVSLCRQLIVIVPAAWLLAQTGNVNMVWWAFPIAELVSMVMCLLFYRRVDRDMLSKLN